VTPQQVVTDARTWIGTPFKHDAEVKGAGCDCAHLLNAVYSRAGKIPHLKFPQYPPDWFKHAADPEKYIVEEMKKHFREIKETEAKAGDVVVMFIGKAWAHCGIISEIKDAKVAKVIEAWPTRATVSEVNATEERLYRTHQKRFFTAW
jgi:NlpC/P60 family putative phage cell wall peptidase